MKFSSDDRLIQIDAHRKPQQSSELEIIVQTSLSNDDELVSTIFVVGMVFRGAREMDNTPSLNIIFAHLNNGLFRSRVRLEKAVWIGGSFGAPIESAVTTSSPTDRRRAMPTMESWQE